MDILQDVKVLLNSLLKNADLDENLINLLRELEEKAILNNINHQNLPEELEHVLIKRIAGRYLSMNGLNAEESQNVKAIKEGDVSVEYGDNDTLKGVINSFITYGEGELSRFRKIKW